jgi:hypothetical protein
VYYGDLSTPSAPAAFAKILAAVLIMLAGLLLMLIDYYTGIMNAIGSRVCEKIVISVRLTVSESARSIACNSPYPGVAVPVSWEDADERVTLR